MKRINTIFLVVLTVSFFCENVRAQELKVVASAGNYAEGAEHNFSWTMGEVVIATLIFPNNQVTQGFHQPNIAVLNIMSYQEMDINVYPNPAKDMINVTTSVDSKLSIYDMQGKLVDSMDIFTTTSSIDVTYLSRGTYTLVFEANGSLAKRMKIVIL